MAKWGDYLISAVWFSTKKNRRYVSHVLLHEDKGDLFTSGRKAAKEEVIDLIRQSKRILTIKWNYEQGTWRKGATVAYETVNNETFLTTPRDAMPQDSLEKLVPGSNLNIH